MRRRLGGDAWLAAGSLVLAVAGWSVRSSLLALAGVLGMAVTGLLYLWQRDCLVGVSYRRRLSRQRALFGDEVLLEVELINDKLLPLPWLRIEDTVPRELTFRGGTLLPGRSGLVRMLPHLVPMLSYQRLTRRMTIICDQRGAHTFGPAELESGDPLGHRRRSRRESESQELLVFPKIFALAPVAATSRMLLGEHRAASMLMGDPSRLSGVREYRTGDPLRHLHWRATARTNNLLVREFEPTARLRAAIFLDTNVTELRGWTIDPPRLEFTIAVAASIAAELTARGISTGLFCTGTIDGYAIARAPMSSPDTLAHLLELLARASPFGTLQLAELITMHAGGLPHGTSVVVVAADFPEPTLVALNDLRRRRPVTAVTVLSDKGVPPPPESVDARLFARFSDDWKSRTSLELAV
jgi:hypothetical protein